MAGYSAWQVWMPIYNIVIHLRIAALPAWAILGYLVPYVGALMPLFTSYRFAKAYGKDHMYCLLFAVFNPVMTLHLAFSKLTVYTGYHPDGQGNNQGPVGHSMGKSLAQALSQPGAGSAALTSGIAPLSSPSASRFNRPA